MYATALGRNIFYYYQGMRIGKFLKVITIKFQKQFFEVGKKWKTNGWNLDLGEKMAGFFLIPACSKES